TRRWGSGSRTISSRFTLRHALSPPPGPAILLIVLLYAARVLWVGVVDSHIQRVVLATEETLVTQQVSHRPIQYQSRSLVVTKRYQGQWVTSWCDNPLLRPTEIQIATKSMQGPTNRKHRK
ncbi:unnamed protein product, partial [Ascophyllum nodosum]